MKRHTWTLLLALFFSINLAYANSITLFDNGSFSGFQEQSRATNCAKYDDDGVCTSRFTVYDDFILQRTSVITGVEWHQTEQKPENYMGTLLTIGSGSPSQDSLLYTFSVMADRVLTLIPDDDARFNSMPNGSFESLASFSELEVTLAGGTYWLGIHNMYPQFGGASQWSQTVGSDQMITGRWQGEGAACGDFPTSPDGGCLKSFPNENSAFRITGRVVSVPEPGTLALLGIGLVAIRLVRRGRHLA